MKIGIISDSHDHIEETHKAIDFLNKNNVDVLVHCGDFCAPFMMKELKKFNGEIHCVFGNTDDRFTTPKLAEELEINFHGDLAEIEIDNKKIAVNHFPIIGQALAQSQIYDVVFHGHAHGKLKEEHGKTLLVNPGEIMGWKGDKTFAIYDTATHDAEFHTIE